MAYVLSCEKGDNIWDEFNVIANNGDDDIVNDDTSEAAIKVRDIVKILLNETCTMYDWIEMAVHYILQNNAVVSMRLE